MDSQQPLPAIACSNCGDPITHIAITPKPWYKSRIIWCGILGGLISAASIGFALVHWFDASKDVLDHVTTIGNSASAAFTALGSAATAGLALYSMIARFGPQQPVGNPSQPVIVNVTTQQ